MIRPIGFPDTREKVTRHSLSLSLPPRTPCTMPPPRWWVQQCVYIGHRYGSDGLLCGGGKIGRNGQLTTGRAAGTLGNTHQLPLPVLCNRGRSKMALMLKIALRAGFSPGRTVWYEHRHPGAGAYTYSVHSAAYSIQAFALLTYIPTPQRRWALDTPDISHLIDEKMKILNFFIFALKMPIQIQMKRIKRRDLQKRCHGTLERQAVAWLYNTLLTKNTKRYP